MRVQVQKIWFFLFLLVSILLCASARNTFFASDEEIVGKARMLRTYYLNDYDNPSANRGHDPGNRMGGGGGGRRSRRP
ncbi:Protein PSY2 [Bienertia sinuspersici]